MLESRLSLKELYKSGKDSLRSNGREYGDGGEVCGVQDCQPDPIDLGRLPISMPLIGRN